MATSVLPEERLPSAIDNPDPPVSLAVCNSPSSHTAGEQDPSTHEKLLEPVSEARGGEVSLDGTLQPASQLRQHPHAGPTAVPGDAQDTESATGVVQGDDQQLTGLVNELMTADGSLPDRLLTGYCDYGISSQEETAGSTQSPVTTTLEEAETKDWLKNPIMANALLPEEEGDGQSSDAVADIRILFCGHTSDTPAELDDFAVEQRKDPEMLEIN